MSVINALQSHIDSLILKFTVVVYRGKTVFAYKPSWSY